MDSLLYTLSETVHKQNHAIITYHISLLKEADIFRKAAALAMGQAIGTWTLTPGITEEIREKYIKKAANIFNVPSLNPVTRTIGDQKEYLIQAAYLVVNFDTDLPPLITALLGNDASTSAQVRLLDIKFPKELVRKFRGPRYGVEGIQKLIKISNRPVLLNMIKLRTGLTPKEGVRIFYGTALGGAGFIEGDELLGDPVYSKSEERVRAYREVAEAACRRTGKRIKYFMNTTGGTGEIMENAKRARDAGADGLMINSAAMGYSVLKHVTEHTVLPILGHSTGTGMYSEGAVNGMTSPLTVGKLVRLAGTGIVMVNTPYGSYPFLHQKYMRTVVQLTLPLYGIKPSILSIGGEVHPEIVEKYTREMGRDVILAIRGAVQGHPDGATTEAQAVCQAIEIVMSG